MKLFMFIAALASAQALSSVVCTPYLDGGQACTIQVPPGTPYITAVFGNAQSVYKQDIPVDPATGSVQIASGDALQSITANGSRIY